MRAVAVSVTSVSFYVGWVFPIGVAMLLALYSPGVSQFPSLTNQYTDFPQINWYRISSRQVRRLMAILPGPVNALYGETVAGAAVIRAFGMQSVFVQSSYMRLIETPSAHAIALIKTTNMHQSCYVLALSIGRWSTSRSLGFQDFETY